MDTWTMAYTIIESCNVKVVRGPIKVENTCTCTCTCSSNMIKLLAMFMVSSSQQSNHRDT